MLKYINKNSFLFFIIIILVNIFSCGRDPSNNPPPPPPPPPAVNAPTITNFTPASGIVGAQVIIDGTNFSSSVPGNIVKFNGVTASIIGASATQLTVTVPANATTGKISVTVNNQSVTSNLPFIVLEPPTITSFSPTNGRPGDQVIISGTNFNLLTATNVVKFNGAIASVSNGTSSQLTVTVPPAATTGMISVTVNGQTATSMSVFTIYNSNVSTFASGFDHPEGIAKDAAGNMYVANEYDRTIRKITPAGVVSTIATLSNLSSRPMGLAVDASGNIFVADRIIHLIWKVT
ncbi:MAG TPA: IPT/TIG domain-containing protein, partial [Bacteroidia bacterium]|nr:IPT/TIG domain-containing protein [Bacteroidia bacterium]